MNAPKFLSSGDSAITVEFGNEISAEINACVHALDKALHKKNILGIVETVPTFRSLLIIYDPCITGGEKLKAKITKLCGDLEASSEGKKRIIEIPVLYGGEYGEDLKDVAEINKLTEDEVIKIHSGTDYLIYMLGFLPGFAYLGGLDDRIKTPRLQNPRTKIHAGAVGIGGEQTGIYPLSSPGGWRLIGTTPVKPYDPERDEPILYSAGDYIRFVPIDKETFDDISAKVQNGTYECRIIGGDGEGVLKSLLPECYPQFRTAEEKALRLWGLTHPALWTFAPTT